MEGREKKGEKEERKGGKDGEKERIKEKLEIMCHLIGQEAYTYTIWSRHL